MKEIYVLFQETGMFYESSYRKNIGFFDTEEEAILVQNKILEKMNFLNNRANIFKEKIDLYMPDNYIEINEVIGRYIKKLGINKYMYRSSMDDYYYLKIEKIISPTSDEILKNIA